MAIQEERLWKDDDDDDDERLLSFGCSDTRSRCVDDVTFVGCDTAPHWLCIQRGGYLGTRATICCSTRRRLKCARVVTKSKIRVQMG